MRAGFGRVIVGVSVAVVSLAALDAQSGDSGAAGQVRQAAYLKASNADAETISATVAPSSEIPVALSGDGNTLAIGARTSRASPEASTETRRQFALWRRRRACICPA
jgi:hypothetical protein